MFIKRLGSLFTSMQTKPAIKRITNTKDEINYTLDKLHNVLKKQSKNDQ
jgi:hypothetical protein